MSNIVEKFKRVVTSDEFLSTVLMMKPKKNIWGFLLIVLVFFVPEAINLLYHETINGWVKALAVGHPVQWLADLSVWMCGKVFDGHISIINTTLGIGFLVWMFKGKENT